MSSQIKIIGVIHKSIKIQYFFEILFQLADLSNRVFSFLKIENIRIMFSTPQSKAYFNQEVIKGKLISEEITLIESVQEELQELKIMISVLVSEINNFNAQASSPEENQKLVKKFMVIEKKLRIVSSMINYSNSNFNLEVSLRGEIKELEQKFFKEVMRKYEQKIKELKNELLRIESEVQEQQKNGLLPYVESPNKNSIVSIKNANFELANKRILLEENLKDWEITSQCEESIKSMLKRVIQKMIGPQKEKKNATKMRMEEKNNPGQKNSKTVEDKKEDPEEFYVEELMTIEFCLQKMKRIKLNEMRRATKERVQQINAVNKKIKEGLYQHKKIMEYERKQSKVKNGDRNLLMREEAIDFLREMAENLEKRLENRNIFLVITEDMGMPRSSSCPALHWHGEYDEEEDKVQVLQQIGNKLSDSFLDQCSYMISDRFIADEDQTDETVIV